MKPLAAFLLLSACTATTNGPCLTYGIQRADMPPLDRSEVSEWVAVTDTAMTWACR